MIGIIANEFVCVVRLNLETNVSERLEWIVVVLVLDAAFGVWCLAFGTSGGRLAWPFRWPWGLLRGATIAQLLHSRDEHHRRAGQHLERVTL